jgi:site-specific DNA-methyltransferase (cytosine-N4-specific)
MPSNSTQRSLLDPPVDVHPSALLAIDPLYSTERGAAYVGDALELLKALPDHSIDLVVTSPPYALEFQKEYGNVAKDEYVEWFLPFASQVKRCLKSEGSFVLNIGGSYNQGEPTRSLYHFKLIIALCEEVGYHLAQELFWYNPAKLPAPAEWVNVRRIRVKDTVEYIWWLCPTPWPRANNRNVLVSYSNDMKRLLVKGYRAKRRPSGHEITQKFSRDHGGSIPPNLIERGNNESNSNYIRACRQHGLKVHPARFPPALPAFFIKFLTGQNDIVLDIFAGSNTTGFVAESLHRTWLAFERDPAYLRSSAIRFGIDVTAMDG